MNSDNKKCLIIVVSHNNPMLLKNFITSYEKYDAGYTTELVIADNSSDDPKQLRLLDDLFIKYRVVVCENGRAEESFQKVSQMYLENDKETKQYKYFFFVHDDTVIFKDKWLKVFIDRLESNYCEPLVKQAHYANYPVGRVCATHQPWRDHEKCLGHNVQSAFLKRCLFIYGQNVIIYKYRRSRKSIVFKRMSRKVWRVVFENIQRYRKTHTRYF